MDLSAKVEARVKPESRTAYADAPGEFPTDQHRKSNLGQYMTPQSIADFMASLFPPSALDTCRLLDAGAGRGALSCAFLERWERRDGLTFNAVELEAFELDPRMRSALLPALAEHSAHGQFRFQIVAGDFVLLATQRCAVADGGFTHAILNPPYKKISSASRHRHILRQIGIETVNLYTAFVALTLELMAPGGQLVAIIPRSFCNGPYYRPFRDYVLARAAIRRVHLFQTRNKAFKKDKVLQENVIIHLERAGRQGDVIVSTSRDDAFDDLLANTFPFEQIVSPVDPERFIHVPTAQETTGHEQAYTPQHGLAEIGVAVSTGPVVDFRTRENLRDMPEDGCVPLLYPAHFAGQTIEWPKLGHKKPNAIVNSPATEKMLYPAGCYCVVRRFSSKEEKRRIVAGIITPEAFPGVSSYGFENHLNVFHESRHGLPEALARGLAAFLNTEAVDEAFRRFNGHTQVNATDLRNMKYPSRSALIAIGEATMRGEKLTPAALTKFLEASDDGRG